METHSDHFAGFSWLPIPQFTSNLEPVRVGLETSLVRTGLFGPENKDLKYPKGRDASNNRQMAARWQSKNTFSSALGPDHGSYTRPSLENKHPQHPKTPRAWPVPLTNSRHCSVVAQHCFRTWLRNLKQPPLDSTHGLRQTLTPNSTRGSLQTPQALICLNLCLGFRV